ncbi:MAG: 50S ribosomal protein L18e [Candidatus Woesearchaeota archaeon]
MKPKHKTKNMELEALIADLKKASIDNKVNVWKRIAEDLEKPTRKRRIVNVYKLSKYSKENDVIVVPGKVLGMGELDHKVQVAAFVFSDEALKKINSKGKALTIQELVKTNPKGKNVKILG